MTNNQNGSGTPLTEQLTEQFKEQTQQVVEQGQEYAGKAVGLAGSKVKDVLGQQKDALATGLTDAAKILQQNGESFRSQGIGVFAGPYIDQAVQTLNSFGTTIQQKDVDEVIQDTENFARVQPAYFLGAATLLGFVAARFLKSSGPQAAAA